MTEKHNYNSAKADAFSGSLIETLNKGALSIMISIGHRSGLFDTMHHLKPSTSKEIANRAKLNERYVIEWLGAMVTGGVIEYLSHSKCYVLPNEHGAFLTRSAGADNIVYFYNTSQ
jgi:hypothetical protein